MTSSAAHPQQDGPSNLLAGTCVAELGSGLATSYAGRLLADAGATVIVYRTEGNSPGSDGMSPEYLRYLNRGKQVVVTESEDSAIQRLLEPSVDAILFDGEDAWSAGLIAKLPQSKGVHQVSVTNYGASFTTTSAPATEFTLQAESGLAVSHDTGSRPPVMTGVPIGELTSGVCAAIGVVQCLLSAGGVDGSYRADISRFESMLALLPQPWLNSQIEGHVSYPVPARAVPGIEPASDGWVCMAVATPAQWAEIVALTGESSLMDPKFSSYYARIDASKTIESAVEAFSSQHTKVDLVRLGRERRLPITPVGSNSREIRDMPQYAGRAVYRDTAEGGVEPNCAFRVWSYESSASSPVTTTLSRNEPGKPLRGMKVVEFCSFQAGPQVGSYLASLGADVVKIESPTRPDPMRYAGVSDLSADLAWERGGMFRYVNLGKRAMTLDLKDPEGLSVFRTLISQSDVILDSYLPHVMDRLGMDEAALRLLAPNAVYMRMPAWGLHGPARGEPGYTFSVNAMCGLAALTGYPDGPPLLSGSVLDPLASFTSTFAVLAALHARTRDGHGRLIEMALGDIGAQATARAVIDEAAGRSWATRRGNDDPAVFLQDFFSDAAGEWVAISLGDQAQAARLAAMIGELSTDAEPIRTAVTAWAAGLDAEDIVRQCGDLGIAAAIADSGENALSRTEPRARNRAIKVTQEVVGDIEALDWPIVMHGEAGALDSGRERPAPFFGQHNSEILSELGYSAPEIEQLYTSNVISDRPVS